jgi:predicted alpha/beta-hydrolase family hydrolase
VTIELDTPHGPARVHLQTADNATTALVLGHGAGGGVSSPDLMATAKAAIEEGITVALVEQPYRVAGRKSPAPAPQLDAAWISVLEQLRANELQGLAIIAGGRSSGARVACRTADETGASGVLCLAFPVHPPGKAGDPSKSRLHELDAVGVPTLVVQGENDPFGLPPGGPDRIVITVPGNHSLRNTAAIAAAVTPWLSEHVASSSPS